MKKFLLFLSCIALLSACKDQDDAKAYKALRDSLNLAATKYEGEMNSFEAKYDSLPKIKAIDVQGLNQKYREWVVTKVADSVLNQITLDGSIIKTLLAKDGGYAALQLVPVKMGDEITILVAPVKLTNGVLVTPVYTNIKKAFRISTTPSIPTYPQIPASGDYTPVDVTTRLPVFCPPPVCTMVSVSKIDSMNH